MRAIRPQPIYTCRPCQLRLLFPQLQTRSFANSPTSRKNGSLPNFTPTSSTELDSLFATFRANVFIPAHLPNVQRNLIYRKRNHKLLTADEPATVGIGDEVVQMVPLSRQHDEPATGPSLAKVLDLMKKESDWRNLPDFLTGLKTAQRNLKPWQIEKIARKACMAGRWRTVMECAERVEGTGLGLWYEGVVRELLWTAVAKAQTGGWTKGSVEKALKLANKIWAMMQDPRHRYDKKRGLVDPMLKVEVVGVMLQLYAARILKSENKEDEDGKLQKYVNHLLAIWDGQSPDIKPDVDWNDANHKLMMWAPVWHGMKMALQVLGPTSSGKEELGSKLNDVENVLHKARDVVLTHQSEGETRRGLKIYEELSRELSPVSS